MKNLVKKLSASLLVTLILLTNYSCKFLSDKPKKEDNTKLTSNVLDNACSINAGKIKKIFSEDISPSIDCLKENLILFIKSTKREDNRFIKKDELRSFINKFFKSEKEKIGRFLDFFFKFNSLIFADPIDKLSVDNIDNIIKLMKAINIHGRQINDVIKKYKQKKMSDNKFKESIKQAIDQMLTSLTSILNDDNKEKQQKLIDLVSEVAAILKLDSEYAETIKLLLPLKKLFLGGEEDIITTKEVKKLLSRLTRLSGIFIDTYFSFKEFNESNDVDTNIDIIKENFQNGAYLRKVNIIFGMLACKKDQKTFMTFDQILNVAKVIIKNEEIYDYLSKNQELIQNVKKIILGGDRENLSFKEMAILLEKVSRYLWAIKNGDDDVGIDILEFAKKYIDIARPDFDIKKVNAFLFLKVLFLGGQRDFITAKELANALYKYPKGRKVYDGWKENPKKLDSIFSLQNYYDGRYLQNLKRSKELFYLHDGNKKILSFTDLKRVFHYFLKDQSHLFNDNEKLIKFVKTKFWKGDEEAFTYQEIVNIVDDLRDFLRTVYFHGKTYDFYENLGLMSSPNAITNLPTLDQSIYPFIEDKNRHKIINKLQSDFNRIAKSYRFFRLEDNYQFYGDYFERSKKGVVEIAVFEWGAKKFLKEYGKKKKDDSQGYRVNVKDLTTFLEDFRPVLEKYNLWTTQYKTFGRNVLHLADLFQLQSNGDSHLNYIEASEYLELIISAIKMSHNFFNELKSRGCYVPAENEIPTKCFRKNFRELFFEELGYEKYMPKLYKVDPKDFATYLLNVEFFIRLHPEKINLSHRELILIIGALLNIESTFIRFDANTNNILDNEELSAAFKVFRKAIMKFGKLKDDKTGNVLAQKAYFYLVKNMELSKTKILIFNDEKNVTSKRLNIGAILNFIIMFGKGNPMQSLRKLKSKHYVKKLQLTCEFQNGKKYIIKNLWGKAQNLYATLEYERDQFVWKPSDNNSDIFKIDYTQLGPFKKYFLDQEKWDKKALKKLFTDVIIRQNKFSRKGWKIKKCF